MKKSLLYLASVLMIWMLGAQRVCAWTGNDVTASTSTAGTTSDDKTFVLYNVGTGKYMVNGGIWGTQAVLNEKLVTTFNVVASTNTEGTYKLYSNIETKQGHYLDYSNGTNMQNAGYLFLDQAATDTYSDFVFTAVAGKTNVYTIKTQSYDKYLTVEETEDYGTVIGTASEATDENAQWQLVSVTDLKGNFSIAEGTTAQPAAASFLVKDPGFSRGATGISSWYRGTTTTNTVLNNNRTYSSDTDTKSSEISSTVKPADAVKITGSGYVYNVTCYYYTYSLWSGYRTTSHSFTYTSSAAISTGTRYSNFLTSNCSGHTNNISYQTVTLVSEGSKSQDGYKYYVGNGYMEPGKNSTCIEDEAKLHSYLQQDHGGQWTANIHGESGDIFQQLKITRAGIYKVSCKGFTIDGTGYLFANVGTTAGTAEAETYVTAPLSTITSIPSTYVKASHKLDSLGYTSLIIKVKDASDSNPVTLTFGALTKDGSSTSWTCVDNFTLDFCGPIVKDLVLDETQTSIEYINAQVDASNAQTLYLFRTFTVGKWNSLVLPVAMTAAQIETAFGEGTMLSELKGTQNGGKQIIFEPATEIKVGKLYIIKPQKNITVQEKTFKVNDTDIKIQAYYQCEQIQLNSQLSASEVSGDVVDSDEDSDIKHVGTYVKKGKDVEENTYGIPANTYMLSGGAWYYNTVNINNVKGFRGWIATNQKQTNGAKTFVINGVEEAVDGGTTAIDGIATDQPVNQRMVTGVYSLNGQKLNDASNTDGLAKGVYIVGGKKVVVK